MAKKLHVFYDTDTMNATLEDYKFDVARDRKVNVSDGLSKIDLTGNPSIREIILGKGVEHIDEGMFKNCTQLTKFDASASKITELGKDTLANCTSLTTLSLPATYVSDDIAAYSATSATKGIWSSLEHLTIDPANPKYIVDKGFLYRKELVKATKGVDVVASKGIVPIADLGGIESHAFTGIDLPATTLDLENCDALGNSSYSSPTIRRNSFYGSNIRTIRFPESLEPAHLPDGALNGDSITDIYFKCRKRDIVESPNYNSLGLSPSQKIWCKENDSSGSMIGFYWSYAYTVPGCRPALVGDTVYKDGNADEVMEDGEFDVTMNFDSGYFSYPDDFLGGKNVLATTLIVKGGKLVSAVPVKDGVFISWENSLGMFLHVGMRADDERLVAFYKAFKDEDGMPGGVFDFTLSPGYISSPSIYLIADWKGGAETRLYDRMEGIDIGTVNIYVSVRNGVIAYLSTTKSEKLWSVLPKENVRLVTVALEYSGSSKLSGMTNDCTSIRTLVNIPTSSIQQLTNNQATKTAVTNAIKAAVSDNGCNLFIFHFSGHGGWEAGTKRNYMCLSDANLYDSEFWDAIKAGAALRCPNCTANEVKSLRVFCIFACCHAATMFIGPNVSGYPIMSTSMTGGNVASSLCKLISDDMMAGNGIRLSADDGRITIPTEDGSVDFGLLSFGACADNGLSYMNDDPANGRLGHEMVTAMVGEQTNASTYDEYFTRIRNTSYYENNTLPVKHWIGQESFGELTKFR